MLQQIRDAITGWLAYVVIAVLIVPFALFGIGDYLGVFGDDYAAKVGDTEIPMTAYRNAFNQQLVNAREQYGSDFRAGMIDEARLRQQTIDQMVNEELLYQYATERGVRVSDERLVREIHSFPAFQDGGIFQPERYRYMLQLNGQTPAGFERMMRRSLVIAELEQAISGTSFIPSQMFAEIIRVADQRREYAWAEITAAAFAGEVEITDEQVAEFYEGNRGRFMTPETLVVELIELDASQAAERVSVDEEGLRAFYEERRNAATQAEERRASHILVTAEQRTAGEAEALAQQLSESAQAGEEFEALAREHSDDPASAEEGGDLGWIERGMFVREFDNTLFALEPGQVSAPVRTGFGWHVLKLHEVRGDAFPAFEEMRDELAADYRQAESDRRFYERADRAADLAFETPDSLEPAAQAAGVEIQRIEGVTRQSGTGPLQDPRLRDAAFSPEVLEQGYNSSVIELGEDHVAIVRVLNREPPRQRELAEVASDIRDRLVQEDARVRAAALGEQLHAQLREGADLAELAEADERVDWNEPRTTGRSDFMTPPDLLDAIFRAPRPEDEPVVGGMLSGDDFIVYSLISVTAGSPDGLDAEQRDGLMRILTERQGSAEMQALLISLREKADVRYGTNLFEDETAY
ncbi:MAG: SurA N-terminal domain-containing protein [Xanthomonadaceae bacterium]|nr:SurA N-terminal domain-containing protein [Xanthomonadaceae bacterium]